MRKVLCLIVLLLSSSCRDTETPEPNITIKDSVSLCKPSCDNLRDLGCKEGDSLVFHEKCTKTSDCTEGQCINSVCTLSCEMFCEYMVNEGRRMNLECLQKVRTCSDIQSVCDEF